MRTNSRLSAVLHALLHMAEHDGPMTSAELSRCMDTNAVVVRRTMAGLRQAGLVTSEKGHGGGWVLARSLDRLSLRQVYEALGAPRLIAMSLGDDAPQCLLEQAANRALGDTFAAAEALLVARLGEISLAEIAADFRRQHPRTEHHEVHHA